MSAPHGSVTYYIGGTMDDLLAVYLHAVLSHELPDVFLPGCPKAAPADLRAHVEDGLLTVRAEEVRYAELTELEEVLKAKKIPYIRESNCDSQEWTYWQEDSKERSRRLAEGENIFTQSEVEEAFVKSNGEASAMLGFLKNLLPPELPPFEVTE